MSAKSSDPKLRLKKAGKRRYAAVTLTDNLGGRREVILGKWGDKDVDAAYHRTLEEWHAAGRTFRKPVDDQGLTVAELLLRFKTWCESHYRKPDGTLSKEVEDFALSLRPLRQMYAATLAADFGPMCLKAVRATMLITPITRRAKQRDAEGKVVMKDGKPVWEDRLIATGLSRKLINQRVGRIKRLFRWAISEQLVPKDALCRDLEAVEGLQMGRSEARETAPVLAISEAVVRDTMACLLPTVAAMVELQLLTGARPGEICSMRGADLDTTGEVWLYRPQTHKGQWRGDERVIVLGPRAQAVVKPWLRLNLEQCLFRPCDAMEAKRGPARRGAKRKPGERYTPEAYATAVSRACKRAGVPHWHPHQLRHSAALAAKREAGLDAARSFLGHKQAQLTEMYAGRDMEAAVAVAKVIG